MDSNSAERISLGARIPAGQWTDGPTRARALLRHALRTLRVALEHDRSLGDGERVFRRHE
ncbi:MAG: hypothetical protein QOJ04_3379 [Caballeronia sp.]|nr:hypothetical protein [Caballeronia sp.]